MFGFPPIPGWDALHPLVIHFPIALLLVSPLFLVIGAVLRPERGRPYLIAAFLLMFFGTVGAWFAVATGKHAAEVLESNDQLAAVLDRHQELAETTRIVFTILTAAFAALLFVPRWLRRTSGRLVTTVLPLVFLVAYAAGALLLANAAHLGGALVHDSAATQASASPGGGE